MSLWYIFIEWKDNEQALTLYGLKLMDIEQFWTYFVQEILPLCIASILYLWIACDISSTLYSVQGIPSWNKNIEKNTIKWTWWMYKTMQTSMSSYLSGWVQVLNIKSGGVDVCSLVIKENEAAI